VFIFQSRICTRSRSRYKNDFCIFQEANFTKEQLVAIKNKLEKLRGEIQYLNSFYILSSELRDRDDIPLVPEGRK
jgi:hypothetical protein